MNSLKPYMSDLQISEIGDCLEKLFIFQDKPLSESKKAILVQELLDLNFPYQSIILGIKDLYQADLRTLKLSVIISSIKNKVDSEHGRENCKFCGKEGSVNLRDEENRIFALACICQNGEITHKAQGLAKWNGLDKQFSNGRNLFK